MAIKDNFKQSHFVLYELQLPYHTVCTPVEGVNEAWHTPLTCTEPVSDATYSLWFTRNTSPIMSPPSQSIGIKSRLNSSVFRVVQNGSEATPRLNVAEGMASRGKMSVTMSDFDGDPGPINFSDAGTFFGKLLARNVLDGKKIISHYYSITPESATPIEVGSSTHFIESSSLTGGRFSLQAKDALKDLEAFSQQFPIPTEIELVGDITADTTTVTVTDGSKVSIDDVIIIDKEFIKVQSIAGNVLTTCTRGSTLVADDLVTVISKTEKEAHADDSAVQICYVMSKTFLPDALKDIFKAVGLEAYIPTVPDQWFDEINEWNSIANLYGVFHKPEKAVDLINRLLTAYMVDMWLDQPTQKAIVNVSSAWKYGERIIEEGNDLHDLKTSTQANTRFSRAYIYNKKYYQAEPDDSVNYSRLTLYKDLATETSDLYGSIKVKEFEPSNFITKDSAFSLVSRYVERFAKTPQLFSFKMEERKLAGLAIGDVVSIVTRDTQSAAGSYLTAKSRAQLIEIKPGLNSVGRIYDVKALSYIPSLIGVGSDQILKFITGSDNALPSLFVIAGTPNIRVDATFIFDGATIGSESTDSASIRAGGFIAGSTIKLIFTNNSKISARGGDGGDAYVDSSINFTGGTAGNGANGGAVYQSGGVITSIYLNYGVVDSYSTAAELYAPGGGGGGASAYRYEEDPYRAYGAAASGSGGSGIPSGGAGVATTFKGVAEQGFDGSFEFGGASKAATMNYGVRYISAIGGAGGGSSSGGAGTKASSEASVLVSGSGGLAGGAIKGTGVTIYNLAASSDKFKPGNSDAFTLITV
jgi:hypothetical protein